MELKYAVKPKDESKIAKAMVRDVDMSPKHAMAIASKISGMKVDAAIKLLEKVRKLETPIPFKRHNTGIGHRKGIQEKVGRYPVKASGKIIELLKNLQANAEFKGLDPEKLKLTHIEAQKGVTRKGKKPKGRWKLWRTQFVHVQAMAKET
ncbi:MAG: 50S ribosomal protein L22 [Candidatus Altiarchaeales archaeon]|nr:50S ribosomal protein L22 [Candidatus Altiarchaeales archaeon]